MAFRSLLSQLSRFSLSQKSILSTSLVNRGLSNPHRFVHCLQSQSGSSRAPCLPLMCQKFQPMNPSILSPKILVNSDQPQRSVIKWNMFDGKRETVEDVIKRYYYLNWEGRGIWIQPKPGKFKRRWQKSSRRKRRLDSHVFCTARQSRTLDKLVTKYWRKQFHFIDDPFAPYHIRDNFHLTRRVPQVP